MKPNPVYTLSRNTKVLVGWSCATCGHVTLERNVANMGVASWSWNTAFRHCNQKCRECEVEIEKGRNLCLPCTVKKDEAASERRYQAARKISANHYTGPIYHENSGLFFLSVNHLIAWLAINSEPTGRVRTCSEASVQFDAGEILDVVEQAGQLEEKSADVLIDFLNMWRKTAKMLLLNDEYLVFGEIN